MEGSQEALQVPGLPWETLEPIHAKERTKPHTTYRGNVTICSFILFFLFFLTVMHSFVSLKWFGAGPCPIVLPREECQE